MFEVNLIRVRDTDSVNARNNLYANCTHVAGDYWLFEGCVEIGLDDGIVFDVIGTAAIDATGDMSQSELRTMVCNAFELTPEQVSIIRC